MEIQIIRTNSRVINSESASTPAGKIIILPNKAAKVEQATQLNHENNFDLTLTFSEVRAPINLEIKVAKDVAIIAKDGYKKIDKKHRIDFWIGIGIGTWTTAILMTMAGYLAADYLNKDMLIGLAIVNPVYFFCMMIGAMKNLSISTAVIGGTILSPLIYIFSTEWALLFAGLIAGSIAFIIGEKNGKQSDNNFSNYSYIFSYFYLKVYGRSYFRKSKR